MTYMSLNCDVSGTEKIIGSGGIDLDENEMQFFATISYMDGEGSASYYVVFKNGKFTVTYYSK